MKRVYRFVDAVIEVASEEPSILEWLDEFFTPAFEVLAPATPAPWRVSIRDARMPADELLASRPAGALPSKACFLLDQGMVSHPSWRLRGTLCLEDRTFGAVYALGPCGVEVVLDPQSRKRRGGAMRAVRELAGAAAMRDDTRFLLHAAGLERNGRAVLVAGPKGAGKTTLLAYLAASTGSRIITNDRALLELRGAEPITVRAVPTVVTLRDGTIELLGRAGLRRFREHADPVRLSPAEFAAGLGVSLARSATLAAILFPERARDGEASTMTRLSAAAAQARLFTARFAAAVDKTETTAFAEHVGVTAPVDEAARDAALARLVPCFAVSVATHAFASAHAAVELIGRIESET